MESHQIGVVSPAMVEKSVWGSVRANRHVVKKAIWSKIDVHLLFYHAPQIALKALVKILKHSAAS